MGTLQQPSKERVRQWLRDQIASRQPPPDGKEIRRELGWEWVRMVGRVKRGCL